MGGKQLSWVVVAVNLIVGVVYASQKDWKHTWYWFSAASITASATMMK